MRHKLAWITHTRPEVLAAVNILSHLTQDTLTQENIKTMNTIIKHVTYFPARGVTMRKLDLDSAHIIVYWDGSFAGKRCILTGRIHDILNK